MSHFIEPKYMQAAELHQSNPSGLSTGIDNPMSHDNGIQSLRLQLKSLNAWPTAGDTFLKLLAQVQVYNVSLVPADYDWLTQVANDASNGVDIGLRYPSIFQKLLTCSDLRKAFLQILQKHGNA